MKTRLLILIILTLSFKVSKAQDLPTLIPESPNAAAFSQYSDIPVGLYSGVPNISIPLYTVKSGEITLPISLSYHASGIKVAQEASWVGLGWVLSSGGMISREIRGLDDLNGPGQGYPFAAEINTDTGSNDYDDDMFNYATGVVDTEPDIFHYNFLGYSGKMLIEKQAGSTLKATPLEQNDMVFVYNGGQWEVTDTRGWKYFFGTKETTFSYSGIYSINIYPDNNWVPPFTGNSYTSGWYLDKILTPSGDEINFTYENSNHRTRTQAHISESYKHIYYPSGFNNTPPITEDIIHGGAAEINYSGSMQEVNDVYLEKIEFNNGYIDFTTSNRLDMSTSSGLLPQKLDAFEVFDLNDNSIKKAAFQYTYFNESTNDDEFMRLKLDAVQESNGSINIPAHQFTYNTLFLPSKKSLSVDHWGYYNGANNNLVNVQLFNPIDLSNITPGSNGVTVWGVLQIKV